MEETINKGKGFTGYILKLIAVVTMFIDHVGAVLIERGMIYPLGINEAKIWVSIDFAFRTIGRVAFPIFCFLLVQGFLHTKSVKDYGLRLLIFGLISEIPFDLALFGVWFYPGHQNVLFTLLIGLFVLAGYEKAENHRIKQVIIILAGCIAATLLKTDYNAIGVILILVFYVYRDNLKIQSLLAGFLAGLASATCIGAGALSLFPICNYNGERGKRSLDKLFYWFYPAHILLLYLLLQLFFK